MITIKGIHFVCKDIKLMTYLVLRGYRLLGFSENYKKQDGSLVWYFEVEDGLKSFVEKWYDEEIVWDIQK